MEGAFFYCHNIVMDITKLCDRLFEDEDLQDKWDRSHVDYVEKAAWIKQMQAM